MISKIFVYDTFQKLQMKTAHIHYGMGGFIIQISLYVPSKHLKSVSRNLSISIGLPK